MSNQKGQSGGLWNTTRPSISTETQNLLKGIFNISFSYNLLSVINKSKFAIRSNDARVQIDKFPTTDHKRQTLK